MSFDRETKQEYESRCLSPELSLQGKSTDHIWTMEDVEGYIGLRLDSGDSGTVYLTKSQAQQVIDNLRTHLT